MKVRIPSALHSYTGDRSVVEADGATVDQLVRDLDGRFPGLRFRIIDEQDRIRPHVKVFVNGAQVWEIGAPVAPADEVAIVQAFSGG
jgi:molybdopterin converting factor small subunit